MTSAEDAATLDALKHDGVDAVSFQALKAGSHWWVDEAPPAGTGGRVSYVSSGGSWIAIGTPLAAPDRRRDAILRFIAAARTAGRRPMFFGVEDVTPFAGCRALLLGLQPVLKPSEWDATLRRRPRLREQLRRARAKGVTVREVRAGDLATGTSVHRDVERLRSEWLSSRHLEPMSFLVAVDPFYASREHLYFVAERRGASVQFLSAVPIYATGGWLMEDMLRGRDAPNGTTELVIDALMRRVDAGRGWITPGLTPLTGPIPWWLRLARSASVALYDFSGLWRFRSRLRPAAWRQVWLVWDRGTATGALIDVLRAFAGGRLFTFARRSLIGHPNGPPWAVAVPLVPWTFVLAGLSASGNHQLLGFSSMALRGWVLFDAALAWLLFQVARHPRPSRLAAAAVVAGLDALLSIQHLSAVGLGPSLTSPLFRIVATAGPIIGTAALLWAAWRAHLQRAPNC